MIKLEVTDDEFFDIRVALHEVMKMVMSTKSAPRFQNLSNKLLEQYCEQEEVVK